MNHEPELNELTLQRCVDGELDEVQQQALLCQLEQHPTGWRRLALAFLEHQLWAQAGREWVEHPSTTPATVPPVASRPRAWLRPTALIASTLLAVGVGYLGGNISLKDGISGGAGQNVTQVSVPTGPNLVAHGVVAHDGPTHPVSTQINDGGEPSSVGSLVPVMHVDWIPEEGAQPVRMPVYDAAAIEKYGQPLPPRLPEATRRKLEERGIQVSEEPTYYAVPIDKHRNLVMPVNTIQLRQQLQ